MASPLPFLKEKPQSGVVTEHRSESEGDPGLEAASHELMQALERKDSKAVASALRNAFMLLDSSPHEEGPIE